jgi:hypothetical protein
MRPIISAIGYHRDVMLADIKTTSLQNNAVCFGASFVVSIRNSFSLVFFRCCWFLVGFTMQRGTSRVRLQARIVDSTKS